MNKSEFDDRTDLEKDYDALAARLAEAVALLREAAMCCNLHDYQFYTDFPPKVEAFLRPADSADELNI